MKLIVFHQLLIASAIIFMVGYGGWELYDYWFGGGAAGGSAEAEITGAVAAQAGPAAMYTGLAMLLGAGILSVYLYRLYRRYASQMSGF